MKIILANKAGQAPIAVMRWRSQGASATLHMNNPTTFEFSVQCKENTYTDEKNENSKQ